MKVYKQLAGKLHNYLNLPVILKDTASPKPKYPYVAYKFTSPFIETPGDIESLVYDQVADKLHEVLEIQPQMVISIDAYSTDMYESMATIQKVHDWFKWSGERDKYDLEIVVVDLGNINDRSFRIEGFYEYRYGFDVRIRTHYKLEKEVGYIEKIYPNYNIEGGKE